MNCNQLIVSVAEGVYHIPVEQIVRLQARSNYTEIFLHNKKKIVCAKLLRLLAEQLIPFGFVRTNRSHLVNPQHIHFVSRYGHITMSEGKIIPMARRKKTIVLKALSEKTAKQLLKRII